MTDSPQLGPFTLENRLGSGGMGVVYRGEHVGTGASVAIKIIHREAGAKAQPRFHQEVQAHAGLQHPGIVHLFEYGAIDEAASRASEGDLRPGDPFVAMELADRGTVRDAMPLADWSSVRRILVQVLDALAYAHARGVIHRDLKPENLLLFDANDGAGWRVKLADFGIAHAFRNEREADTQRLETAAGTPRYMAPEQFRGQWRRYGPWTDLYAVGCIAWELVCGRPPFTADNDIAVGFKHIRKPRPPLDPQFPVPETLEDWIHRAMNPDSERRFRRAADAAWALPTTAFAEQRTESNSSAAAGGEMRSKSDEASTEPNATTKRPLQAPTLALSALGETTPSVGDHLDNPETGPDLDQSSVPDDDRPPLPEDWRPAEAEGLPAPLIGAGLGLFGLREPPFVDREIERDRIWRALEDVVENGSRATVVISSEAGTGKTRLAEWMATRAHEIGAVRVIRAVHTSGGGANEGLPGALERALRTVKMDREEVFEHLRATLPALEERDDEWTERDARALTEYLRPTDDRGDEIDGPAYQFSSPGQKYALVARVLERLARARPLLMWLDDLQWGTEALGLLEHLHERNAAGPAVLVLATVRSDLTREDPSLHERIDTLAEDTRSTSIRLEPLSRHHQRELLVDLLPLEDELADDLARRTEGHPLFATQLLGHWIEEERIEVGPEGFRVAEASRMELPEDIHQLWQRRLARFVADRHPELADRVERAIERAAALGREVDGAEWHSICEKLGVDGPDRIRDGLIERGLAERSDSGWSFAHGLIVASLERRAKAGDRWEDHHRRCATLLDELYPNRPKQTAARRANHWVEAGKLERALQPLLEEADRFFELGAYARARRLIERRREILDALELPDDDPRCIENDNEAARFDAFLGAPADSVLADFQDVRDRAEKVGDIRLLAIAWTGIAWLHQEMGEYEEARKAGERATRRARRCDDVTELIRATAHWGLTELFLGSFDEAEERFSEAHEYAVETGDRFHQLQTHWNIASVAMYRSDYERASKLIGTVLAESRNAGYRELELKCLFGLGEIARFNGEAEAARHYFRRAGGIARELHVRTFAALSHLNLAQVDLMEGRFERAGARIRRTERQYDSVARRDDKAHLIAMEKLTWAAGTKDWAQFDELWTSYADGWPEGAPLLKDHPWLLEMAGDYAAEADAQTRAERVWELARELWARLDHPEAVTRLDEKLSGASE